MKKYYVWVVVLSLATTLFSTSCKDSAEKKTVNDSDSVAVLPDLVEDTLQTAAARFYAGVDSTGVTLNTEDGKAWSEYSANIKKQVDAARKSTLQYVDSIAKKDFSDIREKVDFVFYPFGGADFLYPITLFPDADTYFLIGLENTGSAFKSIEPTYSMYSSYRKALDCYFRLSYYITNRMDTELANDDIDGTIPVLAMLMAIDDYKIISIKEKAFDENGAIVDAQADIKKKAKLSEIKFFKNGSKHEQTLYFYSDNMHNKCCDPNFNKFAATLSKHNVATYLKAASYLMHEEGFADIRNIILDNSFAVVEDDSGIPLHSFTEQGCWDITLYGIYKRPLGCFTSSKYQMDMVEAYKQPGVRNLPFRIGYNNPSNWMCARKKTSAVTNAANDSIATK